jgi:hypothetical protein
VPLLRRLLPPQAQARGSRYRLWEEAELVDLCGAVGLEGYTRTRQFRFILFSARKPALPAGN